MFIIIYNVCNSGKCLKFIFIVLLVNVYFICNSFLYFYQFYKKNKLTRRNKYIIKYIKHKADKYIVQAIHIFTPNTSTYEQNKENGIINKMCLYSNSLTNHPHSFRNRYTICYKILPSKLECII